MSIETGYRPPHDSQDARTSSKGRWKKWLGAAAALGTAAYVGFSKPDSQSEHPTPPDEDTSADVRPVPQPEEIDPLSPDTSSLPLSEPTSEPVAEREKLSRPLPPHSDRVRTKELGKELPVIPPELQEQLDSIDSLCRSFFDNDPARVLDPLYPPIIYQIENKIRSVTDNPEWQKNYPDAATKEQLRARCEPDRMNHRARELVEWLKQSDWSPKKKWEALRFTDSNILLPGLWSEPEVVQMEDELRAASLPSFARSDEENAQKIADERKYYDEVIQMLTGSGYNLTPEEMLNLGIQLEQSLIHDHDYPSFYSPEEREEVRALVRDYRILPQLTQQYRELMQDLDNPPEYSGYVNAWQLAKHALLGSILKEMKEYGINNPQAIGSDYSLEELEQMRDDLKPNP